MAGEVAVFADTTLGTRIALNAPQDITAGALKREFERVHFTCLPDTGVIQVNGLMVKRKSCFYYLPDSLPIKYAFPGMRTWFLHVEVRHLKSLCAPCLPQSKAILSELQDLMTCNNENKVSCNISDEKRIEGFCGPAYSLEEHGTANHIINKQKKGKGSAHENYRQNPTVGMPERCSGSFKDILSGTTNKSQYVMPENKVENLGELSANSMQGRLSEKKTENLVELNANSMQGSLSKMSTEVISVTGIINKYFSGFNEIDDFSSSSKTDVASRAVNSETEVQSKTRSNGCSMTQIDPLPVPQFTPKTPPHLMHTPLHVDLVSKSSGDRGRRPKVGKRLLVASRNLGVSTTKHNPTLSLCRFKDGKLREYKSQINSSIFVISDGDI